MATHNDSNAADTTNATTIMEKGKKYEVFSIKQTNDKYGRGTGALWVRAGSAWVNNDGSINVYLDVLPLDGKLHIREPLKRVSEDAQADDAKA